MLCIASTNIYIFNSSAAGEHEHLANAWENMDGVTPSVGSVSLAFYSGLFAYAGWYVVSDDSDDTVKHMLTKTVK